MEIGPFDRLFSHLKLNFRVFMSKLTTPDSRLFVQSGTKDETDKGQKRDSNGACRHAAEARSITVASLPLKWEKGGTS